jgi:hypothetical protein
VHPDIAESILRVTGSRPTSTTPMGGGCVGDVKCIRLENGTSIVAKFGNIESGLAIEGYMLDYLAAHGGLPVPEVLHAEDTLLLMI